MSDTTDPFTQNIEGVANLIGSDINKQPTPTEEEVGQPTDALELKMSDQELLDLSKVWKQKHDGYYKNIESRTKANSRYYSGNEIATGVGTRKGVASNLIFEAKETFIPEALAKNPEPVVWSDNTTEGQEESSQIKAMLQYKADTMGLRKKLAVTLRKWDIYFIGILKHGWDAKGKDFETSCRRPQDFIYDPDAYIDEVGRYIGEFLGERIPCTAKKMIEKFPKQEEYIFLKVDGKLGTKITYTEWWTDEYCFYTFEDIVLDKHKNEFFNYPDEEKNTPEQQADYGLEAVTVTPGKNHFSQPIMPYSFLSVFSLQEQPHDITSLTEQSIPNQDRIVERDLQITKNLRTGNNSLVLSMLAGWNSENARQGAQAIEDGDPILAPQDCSDKSIRRLPASPLPNGIMQAQEVDKQALRSIYGTQGLTASKQTAQTTARGEILNNDRDSSRIGGGIGEAIEQLADNVFNWWLQMMYVFYDKPHYAAVIGSDKAVEYTQLVNSNINRQFVVSVAPNSMAPKDEISEQNQAVSLFEAKALDPLTLFKKLNFPDPQEAAQMLMLYLTNPQQYAAQLGVPAQQAPPTAGGAEIPPQGQPNDTGLAEPSPAENVLSQVPINTKPK